MRTVIRPVGYEAIIAPHMILPAQTRGRYAAPDQSARALWRAVLVQACEDARQLLRTRPSRRSWCRAVALARWARSRDDTAVGSLPWIADVLGVPCDRIRSGILAIVARILGDPALGDAWPIPDDAWADDLDPASF